MCIFFDQDGRVVYRYRTYGVDEVVPFSPEPRIRPNNRVNLVSLGAKGPEQHRGNWGLNTGRFDWNTRDDRLVASLLWSTMWMQPGAHVVVPMSHAYESTARFGARRWFAVQRRDGEPLWVPGLGRIQQGAHRVEWHVSVVTVDAGPVFEPIHDTPREIVCLRSWDEALMWMQARDEDALRAMLRPSGTDLLESYRVSDDVLRESYAAEKCPEPYSVPAQRGLDAFG
ncbi:MAG: SOS response-associated peptidase family protein [Thermoplasmatota archaeon]